MKIAGVVAAAGLSSRMGAFKPLLPYEGATVIEATAELLRKSGADRVFVVVGHNGGKITPLFENKPWVTCVENPVYGESDMFSSVRIGLEAAKDFDYVFFLPGDMPAVEDSVCKALLKLLRDEGGLWGRPTREGKGQHPVLLTRLAVEHVLGYCGGGGLRGALRSLPQAPLEMPVESLGCTIDIDTPDEYHFLLRYTAEKKRGQEPHSNHE